MRIVSLILPLIISVSVFSQYTEKRIYYDTDPNNNDTLLLKDGTDSLFRFEEGVYVFAMMLKVKNMVLQSEIIGWNTAMIAKQDVLGYVPLNPANNLSEVTPATARSNLGAQATLLSGTNIKTINGSNVLGSGDLVVSGAAAWGSVTGTLSNQTDLQTALDTKLPKTTTSGVGSSPTASSTQTITHNLGRVPSVIRIYGYGSFTSNAAATATTSSIGVFTSSGNFCVYQRYGAAITTTQAGLSSNTFSILLATGGGSFISGVIQNVTATTFDIVWTETGTATAQVYLWEAQ